MHDHAPLPRGWARTGIFILPFLLAAAVFFYFAYVGWASGTALKTRQYSYPPYAQKPPYGSRPLYGGVYTREESPREFWTDEILYLGGAVALIGMALQILWEEHKLQQHQKFLLTLPP
jgi:hypothetical protein